jgi:hypothetical protein
MTTAYRAWSMRLRGSRISGKNEPLRSFGIRRSMSPAFVDSVRGRAVAFVDAGLAALVAGRADHLGGFDLDELRQHRAGRLADQVDCFAGPLYLQHVGHGRLGRGHRWVPFGECLAVHTADLADGFHIYGAAPVTLDAYHSAGRSTRTRPCRTDCTAGIRLRVFP